LFLSYSPQQSSAEPHSSQNFEINAAAAVSRQDMEKNKQLLAEVLKSSNNALKWKLFSVFLFY